MSDQNERKIVVNVIEDNGQVKALLPEATFVGTGVQKKMTLAEIPDEVTSGFRWAPWGEDDCLPTSIREKFDEVGIAGRVSWDLATMLYGNGLVYVNRADIEQNPKEVPRAYTSAVEEFIEENLLETKWLFPQMLSYRWYWNGFSELSLNETADFVSRIYHKEAEFCRVGLQNKKNFRIEEILYSPDFALGNTPPDDRIKKIPLMPWFDQDGFLEKLKKGKKRNFAWHSRIQTPGSIYYSRPYWIGLIRENGWADVAKNVPEIITAMQKNQIVLKYQILIPESYFEVRYGIEWKSYNPKKKGELIDKLIKKINDTLSGTDNVFKSITTLFRNDDMGREVGKIEIIAVDDKVKKDSWVPSSEKADAQIVQQLGGHPSMIGLAPEGGKMGAGSGSDKREVFNMNVDMNTVEQQAILEPLQAAVRINKKKYKKDWDIVFMIDHNRHTTKDKQESGVDLSENANQN